MLAHREARARLGVAGEVRDDLTGADLRERLDPVGGRARGVRLEQDLAQVVVERDRGVRGGVGAAGDGRVGLAESDLVGDQDRRLEAGAARLAHVERGGLRRELRAEDGLAGQVDVARVLEHRAGRDLAEPLAFEPVLRGKAVDDGGQHVLVGSLGVLRVRAREGNPVPPEHVRGSCLIGHREVPFVSKVPGTVPGTSAEVR